MLSSFRADKKDTKFYFQCFFLEDAKDAFEQPSAERNLDFSNIQLKFLVK